MAGLVYILQEQNLDVFGVEWLELLRCNSVRQTSGEEAVGRRRVKGRRGGCAEAVRNSFGKPGLRDIPSSSHNESDCSCGIRGEAIEGDSPNFLRAMGVSEIGWDARSVVGVIDVLVYGGVESLRA